MLTLDTNTIIYYLQDDADVVELFEQSITKNTPLYVAGVSETELLGYPPLTEHDIRAIEDVLAYCTVIHTNPTITRLAGALRRQYKTPTIDALIAATALFTNSTLVTRNTSDFKDIEGLSLERV